MIDATKGFCFATFSGVQEVVLALEVLADLEVDGRTLVAKCNSVSYLMCRRQNYAIYYCFNHSAFPEHPCFLL